VLHGRSGHHCDSGLHGDGKLRVHCDCDVFNSALRDPDQGLLHNGVLGEDAEIGFGDDLEFHPWDFAEHDGEFLVELNDDEDTI